VPSILDTLAGEDLDTIVPADRVGRVANDEGGVAKGAEWLTEFWAKGRTRAWVLGQTPFLHAYGHYLRGAGRPRHVGTPEPLIASFRRPLSDPARPP